MAEAVAAPVLWIFVSGTIESFFVDRLAENLKVQAGMLASELTATGKGANLEDLSKKYKGITGARVTIIDAGGKVLGDRGFGGVYGELQGVFGSQFRFP